MRITTKQQGVANWAALQEFVAKAHTENPKLAEKSARFAQSLAKRQERETARILARPGSKAYKDYMSVPI